MKNLTTITQSIIVMVITVSMLTFIGCSKDDKGTKPKPKPKPEAKATKTLYQLVADNEELSTLKKYLDADDSLKKITKGKVAYTLFAPSNTAFKKLAEKIGSKKLGEISAFIIRQLLTYHLAMGTHTKAKMVATKNLKMHYGEDPIAVNSDGTIKDAGTNVKLTKADIKATNGIMHIIDAVLVPPSLMKRKVAMKGTIAEFIFWNKNFSEYAKFIAFADKKVPTGEKKIAELLADKKQKYTVFVINNKRVKEKAYVSHLPEGEEKLSFMYSEKPRKNIMSSILQGEIIKDFKNGKKFKMGEYEYTVLKKDKRVGLVYKYTFNKQLFDGFLEVLGIAINKASNGVVHLVNDVPN